MSDGGTFREYAQRLAPRGLWFRDAVSQSWLRAVGGMPADSLDIWQDTVQMRFAAKCPDDALHYAAAARQIERAPRETAGDFRDRLQLPFTIHTDRTTDDAYRNVLAPLGVAGSDVYPWDWWEAGIGAWWSTVWVMVDATSGDPWGPAPECDDGLECDDGILCDVSGLTADEVAFIRRQIRKWKLASAYPVGLWILLSGQFCDMGLLCDNGLECDDGDNASAIVPLGKVTEQENLLWGAGPPVCDSGIVCDGVFYDE